MLHVIVKAGRVIGVCKLAENPKDEPTWLEIEFDYKIEYVLSEYEEKEFLKRCEAADKKALEKLNEEDIPF